MSKTVVISFLFICVAFASIGQTDGGFTITAIVVDGDTTLMKHLPQVIIKDQRKFKSRRQAIRYNRLIRNVKKVYPYSKVAGQLLREYNDTLAKIENPRARRKLMKKCEDELWDQFGDEMKQLTMKQGMILIKLIDRETGNTSYELVQDLRGGITAFLFQSIARFFHLNLKQKYNVQGEDQQIEDIVLLIEHGDL